MDAAATVLTELAESLDARRLAEAARQEPCTALLQRLGWMLDALKFKSLTGPLHAEVSRRRAGYVLLNSALKEHAGPREACWNVIVNEVPESEL